MRGRERQQCLLLRAAWTAVTVILYFHMPEHNNPETHSD